MIGKEYISLSPVQMGGPTDEVTNILSEHEQQFVVGFETEEN